MPLPWGRRNWPWGAELLQQRMGEAEFAVLSANAVFSDTGRLVAQPYTTLEMDGHRLGIIGLTRLADGPLAD